MLMKITLFVLLLTVSSAFAKSSYSQNTKLTLHMENATLQQVFDEIKKKSEFIIFYKDDQVNLNHQSNIHVEDAPVDQILIQAFEGTNLGYRIMDRQIVVFANKDDSEPTAIVNPNLAEQKKELSGIVKDINGVGLPGVTVLVKETTIGIVTDINGEFKIMAPADSQILVFSFIGMKTQEISILGKSIFDVVMEEVAVGIEEVVAVGYGTQKKVSVVGAISTASGDILREAKQGGDFTNAMKGILPGMVILQSNGRPGGVDYGIPNGGTNEDSYSKIIIRGVKSWNNSDPLILVDGVERQLYNINPYEIENVSVLKDASATAVFGVKGANGVILITTLRGSEGKAKLSFDVTTTAKSISRIPKITDSYTASVYKNYAILNEVPYNSTGWNAIVPEKYLEYYKNKTYPEYLPDVDWLDEFSKEYTWDQNVNMSVTGGTKFVKYYGSVAYLHEGDILNISDIGQGYNPSYDYRRLNFRSNLDFSITPTTKFSVNIAGSYGVQKKPAGSKWGAWYTMYRMPPDVWPVKYSDGTWGQGTIADVYINGVREFNTNGYYLAKNTDVTTDFILDQKLDFWVKGLSANAKLSYDNRFLTRGRDITADTQRAKYIGKGIVDEIRPGMTSDQIKALEAKYTTWMITAPGTSGYDFAPRIPALGTEVADDASTYRNLFYQLSLNYARDFGKHNVTGLFLFSRNKGAYGSVFPSYREDWVGRATYNYNSRYLVELNGAYNGSEKFAPKYRFGFFPSMAVGWVLSNETFFSGLKSVVNNFKLRYSDGLVGSDAGIARWLYNPSWIVEPSQGTWAKTNFNFGYPTFTASYGFRREGVVANEEIRWETAHKRDLGIEAGFFKDKVRIIYDYFAEKRSNIFLPGALRPIPSYLGTVPVAANLGEAEGHGWELEIYLTHTFPNGINVWASNSMAYAVDKVIEKGDAPLKPEYQKAAGFPINTNRAILNQSLHSVMTSWDDVYNSVGAASNAALLPGDFKRIDYNADGVIDGNDNVPYGYPIIPMHTYAPAIGVNYKKLSANLRFYGVYNVAGSTGQYTNTFSAGQTVLFPWDIDQRFLFESDNASEATVPHARVSSTPTGGYVETTRAYLRLQSAEVSYLMDTPMVKKMGLTSVRFMVSGNNLFLWSKMYEDLDYNGTGSDSRTNYPVLRRFNFGLNIVF